MPDCIYKQSMCTYGLPSTSNCILFSVVMALCQAENCDESVMGLGILDKAKQRAIKNMNEI